MVLLIDTRREAMTAFLLMILAPLAKVSPFVLRKVTPILMTSSGRLWKAAFPIAIGIVADLADDGKLNDSQATAGVDGLDKHKMAVEKLHQELTATGKFTADEIGKLHLGAIILAAYCEQFQATA